MPANPIELVSARTLAENIGRSDITDRVLLRWARLKVIPCVRINRRVVKFNIDAVRTKLGERK